jgi:uncharacterized protein YciI
MFIIELTYKADLSEIDAHMKAHVAFLKKHYAAGHFLVSGRKIPRDGGIIVAVGNSREEIEAIAAEDPFCRQGLADARIIEFRASQRADDIQEKVELSSREAPRADRRAPRDRQESGSPAPRPAPAPRRPPRASRDPRR